MLDRINGNSACADCKICCRGYGGTIFPSDLINENDTEFTVELVLRHIDDDIFPMCLTRMFDGWGLSYRTKNKYGNISDNIKYPMGYDVDRDYNYTCVALGATGCKLSLDKRPINCATYTCKKMLDYLEKDTQGMTNNDYKNAWSDEKVQRVMKKVFEIVKKRNDLILQEYLRQHARLSEHSQILE
ncbi:MAG: hypothetical protein LBM09_01215 [Candidatus Nomurabacteria bacterium]|jgi:hypothetical protein|nr:hypothetical protein [Candidatus Nomurabacteria bacterium]